jgi:hypothetical protein
MAPITDYHPTRPVRTILFILLAAISVSGCTADFYERQADRQVSGIVKEREKQTLGYTPEAEAKTDPKAVKATTQAYAKIPQTPIPAPGVPQVEPLQVELHYGPLGPKRFDWPNVAQSNRGTASYESLDSKIRDRLRLGPPSLAERPLRLDFFASLRYAVQHSRSYQDQMEELYLAALNVTLQRHLFEPRPFAGASLSYLGGQRDVNYRSALNTTLRAGVRQRLPYGGEVVAQGLVDFVNALNDNSSSGETAEVVLSASVPLLRGAGMVNLEPLISGERRMVYQVRTFENFRRDFVISLSQQYFRLINLQAAVLDRRLNYASFEQLTERSRALYAAGRIAFLELQRSLQELLTAENSLIDSQETYLAALDDFKLLLGMPVEQGLEIVPVELDVDFPKIGEEEAIDLALKYRLDFRTAQDQVDDARRGVANARNGLLPDLTFGAEGHLGNRTDTPASRLDERTNNYAARLDLDLPLDRVAERNDYRKALIDVRRASRDMEDLRDRIMSDVRESLRLIQQSNLSLQIQRQGIDLATKRRENAYELLRSGKSNSTRDLVEAQNSLLRARDQFESARATQQINILRFLRNCGTLRLDPGSGGLGTAMDRASVEKELSNILPVTR